MKNWKMVEDPLLPTPSGSWDYWHRIQHYGMPLRAAANVTTVANGYFSLASSVYWNYPAGSALRADGIAGAGMEGVTKAGDSPIFMQYVTAPSLSQTAISAPADTVMLAGSGNWDMWWGVFANIAPFRTCGGWRDGAGTNAPMVGGYTWSYAGPHARKSPRPDSTSSGDATGFAAGCAQPKGLVNWVAADGSARGTDWRGQMTKGTNRTGYYTMDYFWPAGN